MDSDKIPSVIGETFTKTDFSTLTPIQNQGFLKQNWKEHLCAAVNLIPVVGGFLAKEIEVYSSYKDLELFRKYSYYIFNLTETDDVSRQRFANEIEELAHDNVGCVLMGMIDRLDNINKQPILANLTKARINGLIGIEDFFRLSLLLERIPYVDLAGLKRYEDDFYDGSGATELLYSTGALQQSVIGADGDKYVLSTLGRLLLKYGVGIDVDVNYQTKNKQINATNTLEWEEIGGDDIELKIRKSEDL